MTIHKCLTYVKLHTGGVCELVWAQQGLPGLGYLQDHLKSPLGELQHQLVKYFVVKSKRSVNQLVPSHLKLVPDWDGAAQRQAGAAGRELMAKHIWSSQRDIPDSLLHPSYDYMTCGPIVPQV